MHLILKHLNAISILLLLISGILLSGLTLASAEEDVTQDFCDAYKLNGASLTEEIFEQAGVNVDLEFKKVFGGTQQKPKVKDLYLSIYKSIKESPTDSALELTAEANQMTQIELCSIFGGNYQLLSTIYDETYNNADLIEEVDRLTSDYEKNFNASLRDEKAILEVYPHEIFVNGDSGDSGFDILYDLAIIEYILFGEESSIGSGGDFGMGSWNSDDDSDELDGGVESEAVPDDETTSAPDEDTPEEDIPDESFPENEITAEDETVNPAECAADSALQSAFEDAGIVPDESNSEIADINVSRIARDSDDGNDDDNNDSDTEDSNIGQVDVLATLPDTSSAWETPKLCTSVFCLVVEFRNKDEPRYEETSNCVKCHVDYIVESLDKTTSVSLNPGKMSGNLLEPGMCKRSLTGGQVNLTFVPIAMPIRTPPADDIVSKTNFWENFEDFVKDTWSIEEAEMFVNADTFGEGGYDRDGSEAVATTEEEESSYKFMNFFDKLYGDSVKQETNMDDGYISNAEMLESALSNYDSQIAEIDEEFNNMMSYSRSSGAKDFYQSLQYEMNQMVFYFSSYETLIGLTEEAAIELKNNLNQVE